MRPNLASLAALALALAAGLYGCGGCQDSPPEAPPAPVKGQLPEVPQAQPAAEPAEDRHLCAVLVFSDIDTGPAPLQVQLSAEGDCTLGTAKVTWDFGDGSPPATGNAPIHTFEKPGTYTVKGTISSDELPDLDDVDDVEIVVTAPAE